MELVLLLAEMTERQASDLHLVAGVPPIFRVEGELVARKQPNLTPQDIESLLQIMLHKESSLIRHEGGVFHCRVFHDSGNLAAAIRIVPDTIPSLEALRLPAIIENLSKTKRGLILFVGPTGSGKTTTLVSLLEHINMSRSERIFTIEDPIHFVLKSKLSLITQQSIGEDIESYAQGLEVIRRADPDVIMVDNLRTAEVAQLSLELAETDHLVLTQMTAENLPESLARFAAMLGKPYFQTQAVLARNIQAVIAQKLLLATPAHASKTGQLRVVAYEILIVTPDVRQRIVLGQTDMTDSIAMGSRYGMQAMDDAVMSHYNAGRISRETAAQNMTDIKRLLPPH